MWRISEAGRIERLVVFRAMDGTYVPTGELTFRGTGKIRAGRFAYARSYLEFGSAFPIDPIGLPLDRAVAAPPPGEVPLAFHDAGPDGWGKGIFEQAFPTLQLSMPEFLALGGARRTGDLAFGPTPEGSLTWTPGPEPLMRLPGEEDDLEALAAAAAAVDQGEGSADHLQLLLRTSADVGGARPKARLFHEGIDWIAKFPAWGDTFDEPRAEAACLDVAEAAGLPVPDREVVDVGGRSVLLVRRFDRSAEGRPFAYLSAGTLLKEPHTAYGTRQTYLDIALAARAIGVPAPERQMYRRLLMNSYLHNTDDHLRNHAVIAEGKAWRLSPVFDIVPHPKMVRHVCAPAPGVSPVWDPSIAFESHRKFGIPRPDAELIQEEVVGAARRLPDFLDMRGVSRKDRALLLAAMPGNLGLSAVG